jgi:hypothetical protein
MINRAITVRQPWANAIINDGKMVENRSWPTKYRGPVAIHAGRALEDAAFFEFARSRGLDKAISIDQKTIHALPRGAVVGVVDIVDCVTSDPSPWFEGPFGFILKNPRALRPIPCRGAMQIFDLPPEVVEEIENQLKELNV